MINKLLSISCFVVMFALLSGCAGISKGITQAFLEREKKDIRQCWITGRSFKGLDSLFKAQTTKDVSTKVPDQLKVLMVHGIGTHTPGYSRRLLDGLVREFGFKNMDETIKTLQLSHPKYPNNLGVLRVHRYMNLQRSREMLFYELTWDSIVEKEKQQLDFDNTIESSAKRVAFNHKMKQFINDTVPDALMYNTRFRKPIQMSVTQGLCWMLSESWDGLPNKQKRHCDINRSDLWSRIDDSNIAIISHSLGSRITLDALQEGVIRVSKNPAYQAVLNKLKRKPIYLYMLSNQLPLLQLGQPLPEIHEKTSSFCTPKNERYDERFFEKLQIVAISDPNDLFSYAVQPEFINRYVDSRLCPSVTNVLIQVANVSDILGFNAIARPRKAHTEYEADSRVLKMLVSGVGISHGHEEVKSRCEFIESIPDY
ncbi:MAG: hypothetical protein KAS94_02940 [Desulfobulbaceae bacterium]|nr:hypothetical protein [Desulfobulbaceae bacterium]